MLPLHCFFFKTGTYFLLEFAYGTKTFTLSKLSDFDQTITLKFALGLEILPS